MIHNKLQLKGKRFHRLIVLEELKSITEKSRWRCLCKCGNYTVVDGGGLTAGTSKSCGCLKKRYQRFRMKINRKNGIINKKGLAPGESSLNSLICSYKRRARMKNLQFELTREEFRNITISNCYYCNAKPSQIHARGKRKGPYIYNGIDRLDNSKGYILNNSVACCGTCNIMKNTLNEVDFIDHIYKILKNKGKINEET